MPVRILGHMVLWLLAAGLVGLVPPALYGLARGVWPGLDDPVAVLLLGLGLDLGMLAAALCAARRTGGPIRAGLAWHPIQRPGVVALCAAASLVVPAVLALLAWAMVHAGQGDTMRDQISAMWGGSRAAFAATLVLGAVLSPVAEELFFRGWLWTALARHWRARTVFVATSVPFLLLHLPAGAGRPLTLLPAVILFGVARQYGRSVRAALTVHAVNNAAAAVLAVWLRGL